MAGLEEVCLITAMVCGIFFFTSMGLLFALLTGWIVWTMWKWAKEKKLVRRLQLFLWNQFIGDGGN